jgi:hypothetical protein
MMAGPWDQMLVELMAALMVVLLVVSLAVSMVYLSVVEKAALWVDL